jgi:hypothetical protein
VNQKRQPKDAAMTEEQWLSCTNPTPMMDFLRTSGKASDRKMTLFTCACCRRLWECLCDEINRTVVDLAERRADCEDTTLGLQAVVRNINASGAIPNIVASTDDQLLAGLIAGGVRAVAALAAHAVAHKDVPTSDAAITLLAVMSKGHDVKATGDAVRAAHADMLRDLFNNPFRPSPPQPLAVLTWDGGTIRRLAQAIYDERQMPSGTLDTLRLCTLADALRDAGCRDEALIQHCRESGPHVRGCWAVDAVLGKT